MLNGTSIRYKNFRTQANLHICTQRDAVRRMKSMDVEDEEDCPVEIRNDDEKDCLSKCIPHMSPKFVLLFSLFWNTIFAASQVRRDIKDTFFFK